MVVLTTSQENKLYEPKMLRAYRENDVQKEVYVIGEISSNLSISYLAKKGSQADQSIVIQKMYDFFASDFKEDRVSKPTLILRDVGTENQQACLQMTGVEYRESSFEVQSGERRVDFLVLFDFSRLDVRTLPLIKTVIPTYDIKE